MLRKLKFLIISYLTKNLLKALTKDDILVMTNRGWYVNRHKLTSDEMVSLREEAKAFMGSTLWSLMLRDLEYQAFVRGRKAKTNEDNLACHYMFYNLDLIEQYIKNCIKQL